MRVKNNNLGYIMLILGSTIGAGLASGQEIVVFFARYGHVSILFAAVFFVVFAFSIKILLEYGTNCNYVPDFEQKSNFLMESCSNIIFLIFSSSMLAGAESLLSQIIMPTNFYLWSILLLLISLFIISKGLKWLVKINTILVPIILIFTLVVCALSVAQPARSPITITFDIPNMALLGISVILYSCCNIMVSSKVMLNIGKKLDKKNINKVAFISSFILFVIIAFMIISLLNNDNALLFAELPMVYCAFNINYYLGYAYSGVILVSIITTLLSTFYSLKEGLNKKIKSNFYNGILTFLAIFVLSLFGFDNIIRFSYPIIGALGFIMLFGMKNKNCSCKCNCKIKIN